MHHHKSEFLGKGASCLSIVIRPLRLHKLSACLHSSFLFSCTSSRGPPCCQHNAKTLVAAGSKLRSRAALGILAATSYWSNQPPFPRGIIIVPPSPACSCTRATNRKTNSPIFMRFLDSLYAIESEFHLEQELVGLRKALHYKVLISIPCQP